MVSDRMEDWMVAGFIFARLLFRCWPRLGAMAGAQTAQPSDGRLKAALEAGKEPPAIVYEQVDKAGRSKPPWSEVVVFSALGFGFWIAYANAAPDDKTPFLVVAATMTVTALGCLALAIMRPDRGGKDDESA